MKKINKKILIVIVIILSVGITSNLFTEYLNAEEKKKCVIEIEEKKEPVTEEYINGTISYPVLKPTLGCKWEDFNKRIEADIKEWKEDVFTIKDEYVKDYALNTTPTFELDSRYEVGLNREGLISVYMDYYQYTGGAHGITVRRAYNYDAEQGKFIQLNQIFKEKYNYEDVINKKINEEIKNNKDMYFNNGEYFKGIDKTPNYYLTQDGIVIYFQLYEVAPYAAGIPEFKIPYELIQEGLA